MSEPVDSGLSVKLSVNDLPAGGRSFRVEASEDERRRLAGWLGVEAVPAIRAEGIVDTLDSAFDVSIRGLIEAEVVQRCVVSLDAMVRHFDIPFERFYSASINDEWGMYGPDAEEIFVDLEVGPVADPLPAGGIDIGAIVGEELALHIDPFPRLPQFSAEAGDQTSAEQAVAGPVNAGDAADTVTRPFADLAKRLSKR